MIQNSCRYREIWARLKKNRITDVLKYRQLVDAETISRVENRLVGM